MEDSQVWAFGWGRFGVLGQGDTSDHRSPVEVQGLKGKVHVLSAGAVHNGAIVGTERRLFVWGRGSFGRLGLGSQANSLWPTAHPSLEHVEHLVMGGDFGVALSAGKWFVWGKNEEGQLGLGDSDRENRTLPTENVGLNGFSHVFVGDCHTLALGVATAPSGSQQPQLEASSELTEAAKRQKRAERFGIS
jgi:alpha-tubulin suppressor-like RCC1 family protein